MTFEQNPRTAAIFILDGAFATTKSKLPTAIREMTFLCSVNQTSSIIRHSSDKKGTVLGAGSYRWTVKDCRSAETILPYKMKRDEG